MKDDDSFQQLPVMVFIHGESFEWNTGSIYDGSVLAAYGHVIVVTLNFRLGILGFLKPGLEDTTQSNFGLIDQVAALLWIQDNIEQFGGDPNLVTLFGHGTGAVCANFLMMSPMITKGENQSLFHRAILMGGTALSDWALVKYPNQITLQVSKALNCPSNGKELEECLRKKRLSDIMNVPVKAPEYQIRFGPIVDKIVIPNFPKHLMDAFSGFLKRFELMYGVTEMESAFLLSEDIMMRGIRQEERDEELRKYLHAKFEYNVEEGLAHTLREYAGSEFGLEDRSFAGRQPDVASLARDSLLDVLSDARTVAPMLLMAKRHSELNSRSYFYVFSHKTASITKKYYRVKSAPGDELPYIFGVPLGGPKKQFQDQYTTEEQLLSEIVMTYFTNFAYSGDPNVPRRNGFYTLQKLGWKSFTVDWVEFDYRRQPYLRLEIPPKIGVGYRHEQVKYWNEEIDERLRHVPPPMLATKFPPGLYPPPIRKEYVYQKYPKFSKHEEIETTLSPETANDIIERPVISRGTILETTSTARVVIIVGTVFLFVNVIVLAVLYYKCIKLKNRNRTRRSEVDRNKSEDVRNLDRNRIQFPLKPSCGCGFMKIITQSTKSEDTYEAVKMSEEGTRMKLIRQMSTSTIDPHSKVREWISQEVVQRCSPKFLKRTKRVDEKNRTNTKADSPPTTNILNSADSNSTINRSPTRPVSPVDERLKINLAEHPADNITSLRKSTDCIISTHKEASNKTAPIKAHSFSKVNSKKAEKVSVAIDATPSGRGSSVLRQQPIELMKSFKQSSCESETALRRSATLDDINSLPNKRETLRRSSTSINLKLPDGGWNMGEPTIIKIEHHHSKSDPAQETNGTFPNSNKCLKRLRSFDPQQDVNVTSKDENEELIQPLTPEEQLMTIKRRNFPKVLPDYPNRRLSMPTTNKLYHTIPDKSNLTSMSQPTSPNKMNCRFPPAPPPRTSSSLGRKTNRPPLTHSHAVVAEEHPDDKEPEIACNNLYVGPLLPVRGIKKYNPVPCEPYRLNNQPIYGNLNPPKKTQETSKEKREPKTIITTDPENPIKRNEPKIIIKPKTSRKPKDLDRNKAVPRVVAHHELNIGLKREENAIEGSSSGSSPLEAEIAQSEKDNGEKTKEKSESTGNNEMKTTNKKDTDNSSSDSSEVSDTGTVKKMCN